MRKNYQANSATIDVSASTIANGATKCHNLIPFRDNDEYLVPVYDLQGRLIGNFIPIHSFDVGDDSEMLLLLSGVELYSCLIVKDETSALTLLATLDAAPHCVANFGDTVYLMTDDGPFRLDYDEQTGEWNVLGLMPQFPAVGIVADNFTPFSADVASRQLTGSYAHWQGSLNKNDLRNLTSDLLDAYSRIKQDALAAGYFLQPVLARYHLLDDKGKLLYSSSPTMVSSPDGFQCVNPLTLSTADFSAIESYTLSATGFRLALSASALEDSPWAGVVATVVIETTPIIDPVDDKLPAQCRLEAVDSTAGNIVAYMPGTSVTMVAAAGSRVELVRKNLAIFPMVASRVASFPYPYVSGISKTLLPTPSHMVEAIVPDVCRFTAHCATVSGDAALWGNVALLRECPPSIAQLASSGGDDGGYWRAMVSVSFAPGDECVVWSGEGEGGCPLMLSPLLCYPHEDAVEMTVAVSCGGKVARHSFPLSAIPGSGYACYIDSALVPIRLQHEVSSFIIPSQNTSPRLEKGCMAVSRLDSPLRLTALAKAVDGDVVAVTSAVRSSSSWDFARAHFYAFATTGVFAISVNAARDALSAHLIDSRKVADKRVVAYMANAVYAVASGDLVAVTGSKATTLRRGVSLSSIAWDRGGGLLWCVDSGASVLRLFDFENNSVTTADATEGVVVYHVGGKLMLADGNSLSTVNYASHGCNKIEWSHTIHLPDPMRELRGVTFFMSASRFDGTLSVRAHGGAGDMDSCLVTALEVIGEVNSPVAARIAAPPRPYVTIAVEGEVSPDFRLHHVQLLTGKRS